MSNLFSKKKISFYNVYVVRFAAFLFFVFVIKTVALSSYAAESMVYIHSDHLGSSSWVTKDGNLISEERYYPYGTTRAKTGDMPTERQFTGQISDVDQTGLYYYNARYYNPVLAKFTQPDPVNDQQNRYTYVGNNPVNKFDPSGNDGVNATNNSFNRYASILVEAVQKAYEEGVTGGESFSDIISVELESKGVNINKTISKVLNTIAGSTSNRPIQCVEGDMLLSAIASGSGLDIAYLGGWTVGDSAANFVNDLAKKGNTKKVLNSEGVIRMIANDVTDFKVGDHFVTFKSANQPVGHIGIVIATGTDKNGPYIEIVDFNYDNTGKPRKTRVYDLSSLTNMPGKSKVGLIRTYTSYANKPVNNTNTSPEEMTKKDVLTKPNMSYYSQTCFPSNTVITLSDGTKKNIQDIRSGDEVMSYDTIKKQYIASKVDKLLIHPNHPGGYLIINGYLRMTPNHVIWIANKSMWAKAETVRLGDKLQTIHGTEEAVKSITSVDGINTVYNLHLINDPHDFFAEGILVHNKKIDE